LPDDLTPPGTPPTPPAPPGPDGNGREPSPINIADELRESYLTYAMSVIISRALPDVRDGLKPSQRRILVAMHDLGLGPNASTSKCAGIVGETMKRYHPHGEQTIYPTLVRMAQDWNMRYRLIHSQGNFGSIAGLPPAAMRYTEARLAPTAGEMLADLERETVDFRDNYDGKYREPLVLPSRFPNLLVNGSDGIAVGMATDIPPHNLTEVCNASIRLIDEPGTTVKQLMDEGILLGPDFPTGGIICGQQGILDGYLHGHGKITLRARAEINVEGSRPQVIITEVPYQQTRNRLHEAIGELVKNERITGVAAIRDESSQRAGAPVRLVLDLKRDADPEQVRNQLYQFSPLEKTVSIILLALVDGLPRTLKLTEMIQEFIRHRVQVIRRRTEFLLREAKKRSHVLEGQLIAIASLDQVIAICRESPSRADAKIRLQGLEVSAALMVRALGEANFAALQREIGSHPSYRMTEAQADAVVRLQLGQLARLEQDEILTEYRGLRERISEYETLLASEQNVLGVVKKDLIEIRDKYGDKRRTEITGEAAYVTREELIPEEQMAVTISHQGYIKRMPPRTYRTQHRGGKGVIGADTREDDFIEHFFAASTHDHLLCFTDHGQVYWLRVFEIPEAGRTSAGRSIANVLSLKPDEKITSVIPVRHFDGDRYLLMATRRGLVKKTVLADYSRRRQAGIIGIALEEGDTLIDVALVQAGDEVVLCTAQGMAIRFDESQARPMGRNTYGVKGISLTGDDEVVGMVVVDPEGCLLTVCANGYGKRTPFGLSGAAESTETTFDPADVEHADQEDSEEPADDEPTGEGEEEASSRDSARSYRKQKRGGKGIRDVKTSTRNGPVVGVVSVRETDDIMLITTGGMVNRTHASEVRIVGRNTQGVRIMNLKESDRIASVARVAREENVPGATETETTPEVTPPSEA
jgi:DNA gyrase subunit A